MPVNHDFTGSLINAFQTGRGIRQQQEELTAKQEKEKADQEFRQKQFEEQKKQAQQERDDIKAERDRTHALNEALYNITASKAEQDFLKEQRAQVASGTTPAGYTKTAPHTYTPFPGNEHPGFTANTPEEQALIDVEANAPALKAQTAQQMEVFNVQQGIRRADQEQQNKFELEKQRQDNAAALRRIQEQVDQKKASGVDFSYLAQTVIDNPEILADPTQMTPTQRGLVRNELAQKGVDIDTPLQVRNKAVIDSTLTNIEDVLKDPHFTGGFRAIIGTKIPGNPAVAFNDKLNQLKGQLALPGFVHFTGLGSMSDADVKLVKDTGSTINLATSQDALRKSIEKSRDILLKEQKTINDRLAKKSTASQDSGDVYYDSNFNVITKEQYNKLYGSK